MTSKIIVKSALDILGKQSSNSPLFVQYIPQYLDELQKNYKEYMLSVPDRVKILEGQIGKITSENEKLRQELLQHRPAEMKIEVPDKIAESMVIQYLKNYKKNGEDRVNILCIVNDLCLPVEQIDRILDKLEDEGVIRDSE